MRLNLGCGRSAFPTAPENIKDNGARLAFDNHLHEVYDADDWINVDRIPLQCVDKVMDVFEYPFDFESNSADDIVCSHLVEHIPHEAKLKKDGVSDALASAASLDGWYAFFYECWRVLKPGGRIHILAPYAFSIGAMTDPTHHRYVMPGSFSYFVPNPDAPFDYQIPFEFKYTAVEWEIISDDLRKQYVKAGKAAEKVKDDPKALEKLAQKLTSHVQHSLNGIGTFYVRMEAIK